jgi:hypothetical protein
MNKLISIAFYLLDFIGKKVSEFHPTKKEITSIYKK